MTKDDTSRGDSFEITYADGVTPVRIGDRVETRIFWLIKETGRVVYVPGISKIHREMEHDGIKMVGINADSGGSGGFSVNPESGKLVRAVKFLGRDASPSGNLLAEEDWD